MNQAIAELKSKFQAVNGLEKIRLDDDSDNGIIFDSTFFADNIKQLKNRFNNSDGMGKISLARDILLQRRSMGILDRYRADNDYGIKTDTSNPALNAERKERLRIIKEIPVGDFDVATQIPDGKYSKTSWKAAKNERNANNNNQILVSKLATQKKYLVADLQLTDEIMSDISYIGNSFLTPNERENIGFSRPVHISGAKSGKEYRAMNDDEKTIAFNFILKKLESLPFIKKYRSRLKVLAREFDDKKDFIPTHMVNVYGKLYMAVNAGDANWWEAKGGALFESNSAIEIPEGKGKQFLRLQDTTKKLFSKPIQPDIIVKRLAGLYEEGSLNDSELIKAWQYFKLLEVQKSKGISRISGGWIERALFDENLKDLEVFESQVKHELINRSLFELAENSYEFGFVHSFDSAVFDSVQDLKAQWQTASGVEKIALARKIIEERKSQPVKANPDATIILADAINIALSNTNGQVTTGDKLAWEVNKTALNKMTAGTNKQGKKAYQHERIIAIQSLSELAKSALKPVIRTDDGRDEQIESIYEYHVPFEVNGKIFDVRLLCKKFKGNEKNRKDKMHSMAMDDIGDPASQQVTNGLLDDLELVLLDVKESVSPETSDSPSVANNSSIAQTEGNATAEIGKFTINEFYEYLDSLARKFTGSNISFDFFKGNNELIMPKEITHNGVSYHISFDGVWKAKKLTVVKTDLAKANEIKSNPDFNGLTDTLASAQKIILTLPTPKFKAIEFKKIAQAIFNDIKFSSTLDCIFDDTSQSTLTITDLKRQFQTANGMGKIALAKQILHLRSLRNAANPNDVLESNSTETGNENQRVQSSFFNDRGTDSGSTGRAGRQAGTSGNGQQGDSGLPTPSTAASGTGSDTGMDNRNGELGLTAGNSDDSGSTESSRFGILDDRATNPTIEADAGAIKELTRAEKARLQREAENLDSIPNDEESIRADLPFLLPEQQDDIIKIEKRLADANGMMITNGTGTGKTYTALGAIKRFAKQGKNSILIVVPGDKIAQDFVDSAKNLHIEIRKLENIQDNGGKGIAITSYANFYQNESLMRREWDLVVFDEAHKINSNQAGNNTGAMDMMRKVTNHKVP